MLKSGVGVLLLAKPASVIDEPQVVPGAGVPVIVEGTVVPLLGKL